MIDDHHHQHFYLNTLVKQHEYVCHISHVPHKIITEYGLKDKGGEDGSIHVEV